MWRDRDFLKLWAAQSISLFGTEISALPLPLTAIRLLHASAFEMGLLGMLGRAPFLLLSLVAGVWLDRVRRRPVLIRIDIVRAILLLTIQLATYLNLLTRTQFFVVTFCVGALSVVFEIGRYAYVQSLVRREQLVEANSTQGIGGAWSTQTAWSSLAARD